MRKIRIRFQKNDAAKYTSHLDLNRMFSRAVNRLQIPVKYTEGFNPHAYLVFGPPLSVGFTGDCEILDIDVVEDMTDEEIKNRFFSLTPMGFCIYDVYEQKDKLVDIRFARYDVTILWEENMGPSLKEAVTEYFKDSVIPVIKRTKRGEKEINLADLIDEITFTQPSEKELAFSATLVCAPQDNLNPEYIVKAIVQKFDCPVSFVRYARREFYTEDKKAFY